MRHLLAKDLRMIAPYAWVIVPGHMLWCAQAFLVPELYFWLGLSAVLAWTVALAGIEWQLDADRLLGSLPVRRATLVGGRYASALGALVLGAALYVLYGYLISAVAAERIVGRWHGIPAWASADGVAAFVITGLVLVVTYLPFVFRFGFALGGGLYLGAATTALLAAVVATRTVLVTGGDVNPPGALGAGLPSSEMIRGWVSSLASAWGSLPAAVMLTAGAALLGAISIRLSIWFYEGRDL